VPDNPLAPAIPSLNIQTRFQKTLGEWNTRFDQYSKKAETLFPTVQTLQERQKYFTIPVEPLQKMPGHNTLQDVAYLSTLGIKDQAYLKGAEKDVTGAYSKDGRRFGDDSGKSALEAAKLGNQVKLLLNEWSANVFYSNLYSTAASLIATRKVNSVEEAMSYLSIPDSLTPEELMDARNELAILLAVRDEPTPTEVHTPSDALQKEFFTGLKPPANIQATPVSLHSLSVDSLMKSLTTVAPPQTEWLQSEWESFLTAKGYNLEDADTETVKAADALVAEALNRKSMLDATFQSIREMPTQSALSIMVRSLVNPPLVALEALNVYYEHVSIPFAGWMYGSIPDIEKAYNEFKLANPDASQREARVYAWKKWEAPGPPVLDFMLKNMLMEGAVDPVTYLTFGGLATRGLRAMGPAGRVLAAGNEAMTAVLDLPFDAVKYTAKSIIPKTISQQGAVLSRESLQFLNRYFEIYAGKQPLMTIRLRKLTEAVDYAFDHLTQNPRAEDDVAVAARALLNHAPVSREELTSWITRLRKAGATTIDPKSIDDRLLAEVDELFEKVFNHIPGHIPDSAAPALLTLLRADVVGEVTEDISQLSARLFLDRTNAIFKDARGFLAEKTAGKALQSLARRSLKVNTEIAKSEAIQASRRAGHFRVFLFNADRHLIQPWMSQLDRYLVRPAAEAYLTFGMYGPMNMIEDYTRSVLGGVFPGRMSAAHYAIQTVGLLDDPHMHAEAISEMLGKFNQVGTRTNWIVTAATLPISLPLQLITRGKVTPKKLSQYIFLNMVERQGMVSMSIRMHFKAARMNQILSDMAPAETALLRATVPTSRSASFKAAPKWVREGILADLESAALTNKLTLDNPDLIKLLKESYTHDKIIRKELYDIISKYPDLSPDTRSTLLDAFDERLIFESVTPAAQRTVPYTVIADTVTANAQLQPFRIMSGNKHIATLLTDRLHRIEPSSLTILEINTLGKKVLNKTVLKDILAAVAAEAQKQGITTIDIIPKKAHSVMYEMAGFKKVITAQHPDGYYRLSVLDVEKFSPVPSHDSINSFVKSLQDVETNDYLLGPDRAIQDFKALTDLLVALDVSNPAAMSDLISALHRMTATYGALPTQTIARATIKSRGLPLNDRRIHFDTESDRIARFIAAADSNIDTVVNKIRADLAALPTLSNQSALSAHQSYIASTQQYLNLVTTARKLTSEARAADIAFRQSYFAHATPKDMKNSSFWDTFYTSVARNWDDTSQQLALINSQLHNTIADINTAVGAKTAPRRPVIVENRPLAPADVAKLLGARNDDVSKMLLDVLLPEGDKKYFVAFVMGLAKPNFDKGFTAEAVGEVYDQIARSIQVDPNSASWFRVRQKQLDSLASDLHTLYDAKVFPAEQKAAIDSLIDETAKNGSAVSRVSSIPDHDIALGEKRVTEKQLQIKNYKKQLQEAIDYDADEEDIASYRKQIADLENTTDTTETVAVTDYEYLAKIRSELTTAAESIPMQRVLLSDIAETMSTDPEIVQLLITQNIDIPDIIPDHYKLQMMLENALLDADPQLAPRLQSLLDSLDTGAYDNLKEVMEKWFNSYTNSSLQLFGRTAKAHPEFLAKIHAILREKYPSGYIRIYRGKGKAGKQYLDREFTNVTSSKNTALDFENTWTNTHESFEIVVGKDALYEGKIVTILDDGDSAKKGEILISDNGVEKSVPLFALSDPHKPPLLLDNILIRIEDVVGIGSVDESELIIPSSVLRERINSLLPTPAVPTANFRNYDELRQKALDQADIWYKKEFTDYSDANMLDAIMKQLYPFWTYESQRWPYVARSFIRNPGLLASWGRWTNNTDEGYVHVPGTSIDINPIRGTVWGTWSTRLMKQDYPEYYDNLDGMGGAIGFFDAVSRYGFYPNVVYGTATAMFGGESSQLGNVLPSLYTTPLNTAIALAPDNKILSFISDRVFPDNFRQYLISRSVDDMGSDGSLIYAKIKSNLPLLPEEELLWTDAKQSVAKYSALFEQLGFARMKSTRAHEVAQAATDYITQKYGYTAEQQLELKRRGIKIWDVIGGQDPWETPLLQELEFFKYSGSINPILPGSKQAVLNRVELAWNSVRRYQEQTTSDLLDLQQDFLTGSDRGRLGPDDFLKRVKSLQGKVRDYTAKKIEDTPEMELEYRVTQSFANKDPMPVMSPYDELLAMYYSIPLEETIDPATGERITDWTKFIATRRAIEEAIPADDKAKWDEYVSRNTIPIMRVYDKTYETYFQKYYQLWEAVLKTYSPPEQQLINEYLYLERTGQNLARQEDLKNHVSVRGDSLISGFRSLVSGERKALRYANPLLDAWLYYWGKTTSFETDQAKQTYTILARQTGRII